MNLCVEMNVHKLDVTSINQVSWFGFRPYMHLLPSIPAHGKAHLETSDKEMLLNLLPIKMTNPYICLPCLTYNLLTSHILIGDDWN